MVRTFCCRRSLCSLQYLRYRWCSEFDSLETGRSLTQFSSDGDVHYFFFNFIFTIFSLIFFTFFRVVSKHDFLFAYFNVDYCYHCYHDKDVSLIHYHNYCIIIILLYYHYHIIIVMINYSCIIVSILYDYYYYYHYYYHYYYYCYYYYYWCVITLLISTKLLFIIVTITKVAIIIVNCYHLYKPNLGGEL